MEYNYILDNFYHQATIGAIISSKKNHRITS